MEILGLRPLCLGFFVDFEDVSCALNASSLVTSLVVDVAVSKATDLSVVLWDGRSIGSSSLVEALFLLFPEDGVAIMTAPHGALTRDQKGSGGTNCLKMYPSELEEKIPVHHALN